MSGDVLAEAVEAAAKAIYDNDRDDEHQDADYDWEHADTARGWDEPCGDLYRESARLALAAALPVVLAKLAERMDEQSHDDYASDVVRAFAAEVTG